MQDVYMSIAGELLDCRTIEALENKLAEFEANLSPVGLVIVMKNVQDSFVEHFKDVGAYELGLVKRSISAVEHGDTEMIENTFGELAPRIDHARATGYLMQHVMDTLGEAAADPVLKMYVHEQAQLTDVELNQMAPHLKVVVKVIEAMQASNNAPVFNSPVARRAFKK